MWDLATIKELNRQAKERAIKLGLEPYLIQSEQELDTMPPFPFPNIGDDEVEADSLYERIDTLFVDKSGFGADDEPALSIDQLVTRLRRLVRENKETGIRLAIVSEGQFQLYLGVWR